MRLWFCLWEVSERAIHFGAGASLTFSNNESCLSISAMAAPASAGVADGWRSRNWSARRLWASSRPSRSRRNFCCAGDSRGPADLVVRHVSLLLFY